MFSSLFHFLLLITFFVCTVKGFVRSGWLLTWSIVAVQLQTLLGAFYSNKHGSKLIIKWFKTKVIDWFWWNALPALVLVFIIFIFTYFILLIISEGWIRIQIETWHHSILFITKQNKNNFLLFEKPRVDTQI